MVAVLVEAGVTKTVLRGIGPGRRGRFRAASGIARCIRNGESAVRGFHDGTLLRRYRISIACIRGDNKVLAADIEGVQGDVAERDRGGCGVYGSDCCPVIRRAIHRLHARYCQRQTLRYRRLHRHANIKRDEDVA